MLWTQKYKPTIEQIPYDTKQITDFVLNHAKQKKKAILIHGPTGTGKTSTVHALAKKHNLELIEINASDYRNADEINSKIGNALKQQSLFATNKLILIDEVDGVSGKEDRGGVGAIADLIKESKYPIILTANDPFDSKFSTLRTKCTMIEYQTPPTAILTILQNILQKEKITADETTIKTIARRSGGDIRGAITDLQLLSISGILTMTGINTLHDRERSEAITQALLKIFKTTDPNTAITALDNSGEDLDEAILWIDENLPKEYKNPADLARAYEMLSKADIYRGRIRKWQYWRYLVYVSTLITAGIAVAKDKKPEGTTKYERSTRILKIWMANQKYLKRKNIAKKIATTTHCSTKKALQETLPHIQMMYKKKHPSVNMITEELDLDEEEVEWLNK